MRKLYLLFEHYRREPCTTSVIHICATMALAETRKAQHEDSLKRAGYAKNISYSIGESFLEESDLG